MRRGECPGHCLAARGAYPQPEWTKGRASSARFRATSSMCRAHPVRPGIVWDGSGAPQAWPQTLPHTAATAGPCRRRGRRPGRETPPPLEWPQPAVNEQSRRIAATSGEEPQQSVRSRRPRPPRRPRPARPAPGPPPGAGPARPVTPAPRRRAADILAAMRARNWVVGLALPLLAAIAVGIAVVVTVGANNSIGSAPTAIDAGFPPARLATADFGGAAGARRCSCPRSRRVRRHRGRGGQRERRPALWVVRRRRCPPGARGGRDPRAAPAGQRPARLGGARRGRLAGGGRRDAPARQRQRRSCSARPTAGRGRPSAHGHRPGTFAGSGRIVAAAVAAGPAGYVIVGHASVGARTVAAAWYAPGLTGWRRATDARAGALDGRGSQAMSAVTATGAGSPPSARSATRPAAWLSGHRPDLDAGAAAAARRARPARRLTTWRPTAAPWRRSAPRSPRRGSAVRSPPSRPTRAPPGRWRSCRCRPRTGHTATSGHRADRRGRRVHRDRHLRPARPDRRRGLDAARRRRRRAPRGPRWPRRASAWPAPSTQAITALAATAPR